MSQKPKQIKYKQQPKAIESCDYIEFIESLNYMFNTNDNDLVNEYKPQARGIN